MYNLLVIFLVICAARIPFGGEYREKTLQQKIRISLEHAALCAAFLALMTITVHSVHLGMGDKAALIDTATLPIAIAIPAGVIAIAMRVIERTSPLTEVHRHSRHK